MLMMPVWGAIQVSQTEALAPEPCKRTTGGAVSSPQLRTNVRPNEVIRYRGDMMRLVP